MTERTLPVRSAPIVRRASRHRAVRPFIGRTLGAGQLRALATAAAGASGLSQMERFEPQAALIDMGRCGEAARHAVAEAAQALPAFGGGGACGGAESPLPR